MRKPKSISAQGACSREEPAAKIIPGDQDAVALVFRLIDGEVGSGEPSAW